MRTAQATMAVALLAAAGASTEAAEVHRCLDDRGAISFTQHGCPEDTRASRQEARNAPPGGKERVPLATRTEQPIRQAPHPEALTVVGQADDGCGNQLAAQERRNAIVRQQVLPGMTRADVESTLGKPDRTSASNGRLRYHYDAKGRRQTITFDTRGCVP